MKSTIGQIASVLNRQPLGANSGLILIGPPCSGKSTFLADLKSRISSTLVVASTDDLIEEHARSIGKTYSEVFRDVNFGALKKQMMQNVELAKAAGHNIAFDQTNMSAKSRREKLAAFEGMIKYAVVFPFDYDTLWQRNLTRNEKTGKFIPEHVIKSMIESYQAPTKAEGFTDIMELV